MKETSNYVVTGKVVKVTREKRLIKSWIGKDGHLHKTEEEIGWTVDLRDEADRPLFSFLSRLEEPPVFKVGDKVQMQIVRQWEPV